MQKLKFRALATVVAIVLCVLAMSAVAKKHVNEGLRWPTAWLALWSDRGWFIAMRAAIQDGASESEIIDINDFGNGDGIADKWQYGQIPGWNTQFGLVSGNAGFLDISSQTVLEDARFNPTSDTEWADPDGAGNISPHAAAGDGLSVFNEYRGYVLDGGPAVSAPTHRRLSIARKELLVEVSEADGIATTANNGTNTNRAALQAAYNFTAIMGSVSAFYRDPTDGAEIDLYWCRDTFYPVAGVVSYSNPAAPPYFDAYFKHGDGVHFESPPVNPDPVTNGGNTVVWDHKWRAANQPSHDLRYLGGEMSLIRASRNDVTLGDFVKLFLGHRHAQILTAQTRIYSSNAKTGENSTTAENNGSLVFVSGIADENLAKGVALYDSTTLRKVLDYAIAHEIGHLVIDAQSANGWTNDEHSNAQNGSVMRSDPVKDLDQLEFTVEELSKINLPGRSSLLP